MVNRLSLYVNRGKGSQKLEENRAPYELCQANPAIKSLYPKISNKRTVENNLNLKANPLEVGKRPKLTIYCTGQDIFACTRNCAAFRQLNTQLKALLGIAKNVHPQLPIRMHP